jgi:catechol 2,3-dioxygenase-like lactoylglutathione lyase family enzyme
MITKLNVASIYVLDKEEALGFYVDKLGLEKGNDVRQGDYRWLTVRVPGQPGTEISLEQPGPPLHDEATAAQLRELITKGALGGLVFVTDDARGLYETLKARGVTDFTQEPTEHFYGTDMGVRDPFGNAIRILQQGNVAQEPRARAHEGIPCRHWVSALGDGLSIVIIAWLAWSPSRPVTRGSSSESRSLHRGRARASLADRGYEADRERLERPADCQQSHLREARPHDLQPQRHPGFIACQRHD